MRSTLCTNFRFELASVVENRLIPVMILIHLFDSALPQLVKIISLRSFIGRILRDLVRTILFAFVKKFVCLSVTLTMVLLEYSSDCYENELDYRMRLREVHVVV